MKIYELKRKQILPFRVDHVFTFFERPENLSKLTPPSLGFQILTPLPIEMKVGALLDYTIRLQGVPVRWTTLITEYHPPRRFVDVQLRGPYSFWHHTHEFKMTEGETEMTDPVRYALPFGWLGRAANALFVSRKLRAIFDFRSEVLLEYVKVSQED